jgi:hypothetical protein
VSKESIDCLPIIDIPKSNGGIIGAGQEPILIHDRQSSDTVSMTNETEPGLSIDPKPDLFVS